MMVQKINVDFGKYIRFEVPRAEKSALKIISVCPFSDYLSLVCMVFLQPKHMSRFYWNLVGMFLPYLGMFFISLVTQNLEVAGIKEKRSFDFLKIGCKDLDHIFLKYTHRGLKQNVLLVISSKMQVLKLSVKTQTFDHGTVTTDFIYQNLKLTRCQNKQD